MFDVCVCACASGMTGSLSLPFICSVCVQKTRIESLPHWRRRCAYLKVNRDCAQLASLAATPPMRNTCVPHPSSLVHPIALYLGAPGLGTPALDANACFAKRLRRTWGPLIITVRPCRLWYFLWPCSSGASRCQPSIVW